MFKALGCHSLLDEAFVVDFVSSLKTFIVVEFGNSVFEVAFVVGLQV